MELAVLNQDAGHVAVAQVAAQVFGHAPTVTGTIEMAVK